MSENTDPIQTNPNEVELARERTKQATVAGWTAGVVSIAVVWQLTGTDSWPAAVVTVAVAAMVGYVCHRILPR
jgi:hypothetical protein